MFIVIISSGFLLTIYCFYYYKVDLNSPNYKSPFLSSCCFFVLPVELAAIIGMVAESKLNLLH